MSNSLVVYWDIRPRILLSLVQLQRIPDGPYHFGLLAFQPFFNLFGPGPISENVPNGSEMATNGNFI
jgi:hypothetical protein